jgi:hypothetical protein
MSASHQVGLPPLTGPIVLYGLGLLAIISLIHLQVINSSSTHVPNRPHSNQSVRRTPAAIVFATALTVALFALLSALLFHIRVHTLPRFLRRADRELRLEPGNRAPRELLRARYDNSTANVRRIGQWDVRTHFSQKVRGVSLGIAALCVSVGVIDLIIHLLTKSTS